MADWRAEMGSLSDADPIAMGPTSKAPYNFEFKPHCGFKWEKANSMFSLFYITAFSFLTLNKFT